MAFSLYADNIIRFDDLSSRLLVAEDPLELPYPNPLHELSIDLKAVLDDPLVWASMADATDPKVQSISFIPESLETYVLFVTGEIMTWRIIGTSASSSQTSSDPRLIDLTPVASKQGIFSPYFLFNCKEGSSIAFSTSEVGQ